jgi:hypothetical protein
MLTVCIVFRQKLACPSSERGAIHTFWEILAYSIKSLKLRWKWFEVNKHRFCVVYNKKKVKKKGKVIPLHAMEGEEVQLLLLPRHYMGVSGQRHAPAALYPRGKEPRYPLDRRLGGPESRSGRRG